MLHILSLRILLFILCSLSLSVSYDINSTLYWRITVQQTGKEVNKVSLSNGLYSPIEITFTQIGEEAVPPVKGILKLSSSDLVIQEGDKGISYDTSQSTKIQTHIGRSCLLPTTEGQSFTVQFKPQSDPEGYIESSNVIVTINLHPLIDLKVTQTDKTLSFQSKGSYTIAPSSSSSEPMMNVDSIEISFKGADTNSQASSIEKFTIEKYPNPSSQPKQFGISTAFEYIVHNQKFNGAISNAELKTCYQLTEANGLVEFSMKEADIELITQQVKKDLLDHTIADELEQYQFDLTLNSIKIYPAEVNCALYCREKGELSDDEIITNDRKDYTKDVLDYKKIVHKDKDPIQFAMSFTSMSRLCLMTLKCIVTPHGIEDPQNFKSASITIGSLKTADIKREIRLSKNKFTSTNCGIWQFKEEFNKEKFQTKAMEYLAKHITLSKDEKEAACISFEANQYLSPVSKTLTTICLIPNVSCLFQDSYHYYTSFKQVMDTLSSTAAIKTTLELNDDTYLDLTHSRHETDYYIYNYKDIEASIVGTTKYYFTISIRTKGNPAVCYFKEINEVKDYDFYEEDFYDGTIKVDLSSTSQFLNVQTSHNLSNKKMIDVYINCLNFPNSRHYHHFAPYRLFVHYNIEEQDSLPIPEKEPLPQCPDTDKLKPQCKVYGVIEYPSYGKNPIRKFGSYSQFAMLDINAKVDYIYNYVLNRDTFNNDDLIAMSLISHQLSITNCIDYNSYSKCREMKLNLMKGIMEKMLKYNQPKTSVNEVNALIQFEYANTMFYISQCKDSLKGINGKSFIDLVIKYGNDINDILNLFTIETKKSFLSICNGILNNVIDILQFKEIDKEIDTKVNENSRVIPNDDLITLKTLIEKIILYSKDHSLPNQYPDLAYSFIKTNTVDDVKEFTLEDKDSSKVQLPLSQLNGKGVDYLLIIVYEAYPLLSYQNTQTNKKVITISAYDKDNKPIEVEGLEKKVVIDYGNIKSNDDMKYCYYFNMKSKAIDRNGVFGEVNANDKRMRCQTSHLSDFLISKYGIPQDNDDKGNGVPTWVIVLSSVVGVLLICVVGYFIYLRYHPSKIEEDIEQTSPIIKEDNPQSD